MQVPLVLLARMVSQVFLVELEQRESLVTLETTVCRDKMDPEVIRETQVLRAVPAHRDRRDRQETVDRPAQQAPLVSLEILDFLAPLAHRDHKVQLAQLVPLANPAQMEPQVSICSAPPTSYSATQQESRFLPRCGFCSVLWLNLHVSIFDLIPS